MKVTERNHLDLVLLDRIPDLLRALAALQTGAMGAAWSVSGHRPVVRQGLTNAHQMIERAAVQVRRALTHALEEMGEPTP